MIRDMKSPLEMPGQKQDIRKVPSTTKDWLLISIYLKMVNTFPRPLRTSLLENFGKAWDLTAHGEEDLAKKTETTTLTEKDAAELALDHKTKGLLSQIRRCPICESSITLKVSFGGVPVSVFICDDCDFSMSFKRID